MLKIKLGYFDKFTSMDHVSYLFGLKANLCMKELCVEFNFLSKQN